MSHNRPQELFANSHKNKRDTRKVVTPNKIKRENTIVVNAEKLKYKPSDMTTADASFLRAVVKLSPEKLSNMSAVEITNVVKNWRLIESGRRGTQRKDKIKMKRDMGLDLTSLT